MLSLNMQYTAAKTITSEGICFLPVPYLFQSPKGFGPENMEGEQTENGSLYISEKTKKQEEIMKTYRRMLCLVMAILMMAT